MRAWEKGEKGKDEGEEDEEEDKEEKGAREDEERKAARPGTAFVIQESKGTLDRDEITANTL